MADNYRVSENRAEVLHLADCYDRMAEDRETMDRMYATLDSHRSEVV